MTLSFLVIRKQIARNPERHQIADIVSHTSHKTSHKKKKEVTDQNCDTVMFCDTYGTRYTIL